MAAIAVIARRRNFPAEPPPAWRAIGPILLRALPPLALPGILSASSIPASRRRPRRPRSPRLRAAPRAGLPHGGNRADLRGRVGYDPADRGDRAHHVRRLRLQLRPSPTRTCRSCCANTLIGWHLPPAAFLLCVNLLLLLLAVAIDEITILLVIVPLLVPVAAGLASTSCISASSSCST